MSSERINGIKVNLATCSPDEPQTMQGYIGQQILEREWELSLIANEIQRRQETQVDVR